MSQRKYWRVQIDANHKTVCPVCGHTNNHIADINNCNHLHKLTPKGVAYYFWGFTFVEIALASNRVPAQSRPS